MKINARFYRTLIKILSAIVILVIIAVLVFVGMQISGRNKLYSASSSNRPDLSRSELAEVVEQTESTKDLTEVQEESSYVWQEGDVRYDGKIYRYNDEILTFLFLGIDKMTEVKKVEDGIDGGQSDAIFLLVLDPRSKEISVIGVNRDTMTAVEVYSEYGDYRGTATLQLCLQHGYGDGAELSCTRTIEAVSKLFYDLPIHGYCSINMGAIPLINDAIGGVELVALEDVIKSDIKEGDTVHLMGKEAYNYLHNRDTKSDESARRRLERQKQYIELYAKKAVEQMKSDITLPVKLYNAVSKYMVTDITVDEVSYLATQAAGYHFSMENIYSLAGETKQGERFEEFYVDDEALYELILKVFYEEVEQ